MPEFFDARAIRDFAAEMQASAGDDLGPLIWRDVQRLATAYLEGRRPACGGEYSHDCGFYSGASLDG